MSKMLQPPDRLALLDIGTNAIRLAIYEIHADAPPRLCFQSRFVTRLGAGAGPALSQAAINRTIQAARRMIGQARLHQVNQILAVATAAVREAPRRIQFQNLFRQATGCQLQIISGQKEAQLVYRGLAPTLPEDRPIVIMDIGGGSTELIVGTRQRCLASFSLPIGAVRLTEEFPALRAHAPVPPAVLRQLLKTIQQRLNATMDRLAHLRPDPGMGTSGTTRSLAALAYAFGRYAPAAPHIGVLPRMVPALLLRRLAQLTIPMRSALPGMEADRADIIIAGAAIASIIIQRLRLRCLRIGGGGLREGLLHQCMADYRLRQQSGQHVMSITAHKKTGRVQ